jgi:hypothetical protein
LQEHITRLEHVFEKLSQWGLKLKPSKCEFFKSEVKYLGHIVSQYGVKTDPAKVEVVKNWPVPQSVKDVQKFVGFSGFYRRYVQNCSKIARPLHDLLNNQKGKCGKTSKFVWTPDAQSAFDYLKQKLVSAPILAYAYYSLPFEVHTDASSSALGAVLYQTQNDRKRVIAYASRGLSLSERHYPAHKLEFLALRWAIVDKFHDYLYGQKFTVYTDNNPLTYVLTSAKLDATGHRWIAQLSCYDFDIKYKVGSSNQDADALTFAIN